MSLDCLDDLVGIINDQDTRDSSICYVNDLPDISFKKLSSVNEQITGNKTSGSAIITNITLNTSNFEVGDSVKGEGVPDGTVILTIDTASQITLDANVTTTCIDSVIIVESAANYLFNNLLELSKKQLKADVLANYQGCLSINSVIENDVLGYYKDYDSSVVLAAGAFKRGQQIIIDRYPYLEFYVHKVRLFFDTAITSNLIVYDLIQKKVLDTIAFTSVANEITDVDVNKAYGTDGQRINLAFLYDGSLTGSYKTSSSKKNTGCSSCGFKNNFLYENGVQVPAASTVIESNIQKKGECYGVSLTYSLNCTIEPFLCSIRNLLQFPLLHLVTYWILKDAKHNSRINSYITIGRKDHSVLADEYLQEYKMQMFGSFNENGAKIKQGLMDSVKLPSDICFNKKSRIKYRTQVP